jgi:DNA-binding transcriptional ArsR family regulator
VSGLSDVSSLRAVAHPVRLRMLSVLTGTAMSAADLARTLDISHANASYHLRQLADAGEVVEAGEQKIRGGTAKLYRYPHESEAPRRDITNADRLVYTRAVAAELERRIAAGVPGHGVPGQGGLLSDLEGWVEPEVWDRASALLQQASRLLHDANRPPRTPDTVHVSFTAWAFRMAGEDA